MKNNTWESCKKQDYDISLDQEPTNLDKRIDALATDAKELSPN